MGMVMFNELELIGSHGGLGGYQTQPFVLYPAQLSMGDGPLVGAAAVHGTDSIDKSTFTTDYMFGGIEDA